VRVGYPINVDEPFPHIDRVARHPDHALDECRCRILGLIALWRGLEDDDLFAFRILVEAHRRTGNAQPNRMVRERESRTVDELIHEQPVSDEKARHHARGRNPIRLDDEDADGEKDGDQRGERLEALPGSPGGGPTRATSLRDGALFWCGFAGH